VLLECAIRAEQQTLATGRHPAEAFWSHLTKAEKEAV
jgi:hypothetical protein